MKIPKGYRETSVIEFGSISRSKDGAGTLMYMLNPDPKETFKPKTIYIPIYTTRNHKQNEWLREHMYYNDQEFMLEVTSIISHESVHIALANTVGREACDRLDPLFGVSFRDTFGDVHGLLNLEANFKPRRNRLKWDGKKGK